MRPMTFLALATWLSATWLLPPSVSADLLAPSLLELREMEGNRVAVRWKTPLVQPRGVVVRPVLPERCRQLTAAVAERETMALVSRWSMDCGPSGLAGLEVEIEGLDDSGTSALVRIRFVGGGSVRVVLRGDTPTFQVPEQQRPQGPFGVAWEYLALGFMHLLTGVDHLLFVLGLLLLVRGWRSLLFTVTAFTLGHSVTLSLASLGLINLSQAPVEATIAFSIFLLAVELARDRSRPTFLSRYPWGMAAGFGLLHGLGFAGALADIGLPVGEIPLALISFNVGIEGGQLLFIALLVGSKRVGEWLSVPAWVGSPRAVAYFVGPLAVLWCCERTVAAILVGG